MRLQKTSPVSTLPRWPRCKNVQQQSVRKHMTSRWFCEGIFVNEVIPKLNKTLPGIFNIRVLPDLSLFAVSFTGSSWKSCWKFIQTPKSISYLHCVFCWELTRKQPDAQGLRNFTIGKKPPTFGQMRRGGEELKQLNWLYSNDVPNVWNDENCWHFFLEGISWVKNKRIIVSFHAVQQGRGQVSLPLPSTGIPLDVLWGSSRPKRWSRWVEKIRIASWVKKWSVLPIWEYGFIIEEK